VIIYCQSTIIGDITIGENSIIGSNSVVLDNVPEDSTAVGIPAKIIRKES
jgi:serine O-acetyltransferase